MTHRVMTILCWTGWALLLIGAARVAWHVVMHW